MIQTATRNATLEDLMGLLRDQHARKIDLVATAAAITARDGQLIIRGAEPMLTEDGVTSADGVYTPTAVCDEGLADKLGVPIRYMRVLRAERPDLWDANVNGWLHGRRPLQRQNLVTGQPENVRDGIPGDPRSFLVRLFRGDDDQQGIARAFLSDRYNIVDNLDVLLATLDGIRDTGTPVTISGADLTETRMTVRVECPAVTAVAPVLLRGYRSPFTGQSGSDNPTMWAGFVITNSETGGGAFTITPRVVAQVCSNGMTITRDALRRTHLGGKLDAGVIRWAEDTQTKALELVKAQTRDAVNTFLSPEYLTETITQLEASAGVEVPATVQGVRDLTKASKFTDAQVDAIMGYFIQGGQTTVGGVANAITAYAQDGSLDGDVAYQLETAAAALLL